MPEIAQRKSIRSTIWIYNINVWFHSWMKMVLSVCSEVIGNYFLYDQLETTFHRQQILLWLLCISSFLLSWFIFQGNVTKKCMVDLLLHSSFSGSKILRVGELPVHRFGSMYKYCDEFYTRLIVYCNNS